MTPEEYVGTPYSQMDCFALVRDCSLKCYGVLLPELKDYIRHPFISVRDELATGHWEEIEYRDRRPGDVVTLSAVPEEAGHVGISIEGGWVLHNDKRYGAIIHSERGLKMAGYSYVKVYRYLA